MSRIRWADLYRPAHTVMTDWLKDGYRLTLRGLHYRLLDNPDCITLGYINTEACYKTLSKWTAIWRRDEIFPHFAEDGRPFDGWDQWYNSPKDALIELSTHYRRNRAEGQAYAIVIAVEKRAMLPVLRPFANEHGLPLVALAGFASQTLASTIATEVAREDRPGVLLIAGDHDPSGHAITTDVITRSGPWHHVERVALNDDHVHTFGLRTAPVKTSDSRAAAFIAEYGTGVVELDALPPSELIAMYETALAPWWNPTIAERIATEEVTERARLGSLATSF